MQNEYGDLESALKRKAENQQKAAQAKLEQQLSANGRLRSGTTARLVAQSNAGIEQGLQDQVGSLEKEKADKAREERLVKENQQFTSQENALNRGLGEKQLGEQARQFNAEFTENVRSNLFNKVIALKDFNPGKLKDIASMLGIDLGSLKNVVGQTTQLPAGEGGTPFPGIGKGGSAGSTQLVPQTKSAPAPSSNWMDNIKTQAGLSPSEAKMVSQRVVALTKLFQSSPNAQLPGGVNSSVVPNIQKTLASTKLKASQKRDNILGLLKSGQMIYGDRFI